MRISIKPRTLGETENLFEILMDRRDGRSDAGVAERDRGRVLLVRLMTCGNGILQLER